MWAMASSTPLDHLDADDGRQVLLEPILLGWRLCSTAPLHMLSSKALLSGQQRISTPLSAKTWPMRGKNAAATPRATNKLSVALQGLYFWVLALSATVTAMSRSQGSST
jgi:hypothetical protein